MSAGDPITIKFVKEMERLKTYLEGLIRMDYPIKTLREGLQYAIRPVGIKVEVSESPLLYVEEKSNPYGYSEHSPGKGKRPRTWNGGATRKRRGSRR